MVTPRTPADVSTASDDRAKVGARAAAIPGVVVVFERGAPALRAVAALEGPVVIGRDAPGLTLDDDKASRQHLEVSWEAGRWRVRDLGSRNGTHADGNRVTEAIVEDGAVLRAGGAVMVLRADARALFDGRVEVRDGAVMGPTFRMALDRVERIARSGRDVLVVGETGVGKELAARRFAGAAGRGDGPFVALNCAAIPEGVAERLLFGALKGTYSGAAVDAVGHLEAARGGTVFLDEVGELDLAVQAKLLRALETREVLPLGALRPRPVDFRLCCATHRDLRVRCDEGRFRLDLLHRIAPAELRLPALRERREEIPWIAARAVASVSPELAVDARFAEAVARAPWFGNVRELLAAARGAAHEALACGAEVVTAEHLGEGARRSSTPAPPAEGRELDRASLGPPRHAIVAALEENSGNVAAAARSLGAHRTQMYRWLERHAIDPKRLRDG